MTSREWLTSTPVAHRGLHDLITPENSFSSIQKSIDNNLPFEIDVQMTSDYKIIVFHDRKLDRMTGKQLKVTTNTFKKIHQYPLLANNEPIPLLSEVLEQVDGRVPILLEIKPAQLRHYERAEAVFEILKNYQGPIAVQSFDARIVKWFKQETDFFTGMILGCYRDKTISREKRKVFDVSWGSYKDSFTEAVPDFVAHDVMQLSPAISEAVRAQMPLITWTVKNEKHLSYGRLLADNIIFEKLDYKSLENTSKISNQE